MRINISMEYFSSCYLLEYFLSMNLFCVNLCVASSFYYLEVLKLPILTLINRYHILFDSVHFLMIMFFCDELQLFFIFHVEILVVLSKNGNFWNKHIPFWSDLDVFLFKNWPTLIFFPLLVVNFANILNSLNQWLAFYLFIFLFKIVTKF